MLRQLDQIRIQNEVLRANQIVQEKYENILIEKEDDLSILTKNDDVSQTNNNKTK